MVSFRNSDSLKKSPTVFKRFRLPNLSNNPLIHLFNSVWISTISIISNYSFSCTQSISTERFSNSYSGKTSIAMLINFNFASSLNFAPEFKQYSFNQATTQHNSTIIIPTASNTRTQLYECHIRCPYLRRFVTT